MPRLVDPLLLPGSVASIQQPLLEIDDRFSIRPWAIDDAPTIVVAYSDPEIQQWHRRSLDDFEAQQMVRIWRGAWQGEADACWAIENRLDGLAVGYIALHRIDLENGAAQVAYWVAPHARSAGVASKATLALSEWALGPLGLHRLELLHSVHNHASCHVAANAGFAIEGTLKGALEHPDGWHDMHLHARLTSKPFRSPIS
jgi:RimJ/RimL family protein N-acetyltransferase